MTIRFEYTAYVEGRYIQDVIDAEDIRAARSALRNKGLLPVTLTPISRYKIFADTLSGQLKDVRTFFRDELLQRQAKKAPDLTHKRPRVVAKPQQHHAFHFSYQALDQVTGESVNGTIVSRDEREARSVLREQNLLPVKVTKGRRAEQEEEADQNAPPTLVGLLKRVFARKVPQKELTIFVQQLAVMMEGGLSLTQALDILSQSTSNRKLQIVLQDCLAKLSAGRPLADVLSDHRNTFPPMFIELIAIGESAGNLEEILRRLAAQMEATFKLQNRIKGAMVYPIISLVIITMMITAIMVFIVPTFIALFDDFHLKVPFLTQFLINSSDTMRLRWPQLLLGAGAMVAGSKLIAQTRWFRIVWDRVEFKIPLIGPLRLKLIVSRILHSLSISLRAGLPITRALENCLGKGSNADVRLMLQEAGSQIQNGMPLATCFAQMNLFPKLVVQFIRAGETTGNVDEMLERSVAYIDDEVERQLSALTTALEPLLTVCVGGTILLIVGALYYPLIPLMGGPKS